MRRSIFIMLLFLASCNFPAHETRPPLPVSTPASIPFATGTSVATITPVPFPDHEKYILNTTIDYDLHLVVVDETIIYPNHTGQSLDKLVLAIAANLWPICF